MNKTIKKLEDNPILINRKKALSEFNSIAHRLELICSLNNNYWINDSKATDLGATSFSLDQIEGPIIWLVGSDGSFRDLELVKSLVLKKVKKIICYGVFETDLKYAFGGKVQYALKNNLTEAVQFAYDCAIDKATVLFSPACSSYDNYVDFRDRGDHFKALVKAL